MLDCLSSLTDVVGLHSARLLTCNGWIMKRTREREDGMGERNEESKKESCEARGK